MERTFRSCDRCGATISQDVVNEMNLQIISEKTGAELLEDTDLCGECRNSLVKWFGEVNPFTGKNFERR